MFLCKSESWKWIELHSTVSDSPQKRDLRADGTAVTLLDEETSAPGEKVQCSRLAFQARILSRLPLFKDQEDGFNSLILILPGSSGDELDKGADTAQRGERDDGRGRRGHRQAGHGGVQQRRRADQERREGGGGRGEAGLVPMSKF